MTPPDPSDCNRGAEASFAEAHWLYGAFRGSSVWHIIAGHDEHGARRAWCGEMILTRNIVTDIKQRRLCKTCLRLAPYNEKGQR